MSVPKLHSHYCWAISYTYVYMYIRIDKLRQDEKIQHHSEYVRNQNQQNLYNKFVHFLLNN